ncbi:sugar phosphate isomerase/epimerase family protein [Cellulomonas dongxiuzhuiae]|uniref:Sugar phosphate isomerase/epimerase n=1 Tax=Cellulomonas dongxiuzhuiae TaxID=2819979 RepID=A0ABX8GJL4_9CELL|nr:sugar phosphate isomerase/epimerase family protein [Cellulomonas dongxiuzhuiae]MBO3089635.1 sugar phosphate isomerase/epimerase [Cellulomonas dongxiuzhuiae]MBO3095272.1 sugar phosphate isomerase/epimerase [Cellulomonas dongxiuzhuiae]QWC16269.1 sugar phosphate isomerase/epimerase [Cellulomonas dongxiuzhuiae]
MSTDGTRPTSEQWPIAAAMLPFPASQDAPADTWVDHLAEVAYEGFTEVDLTDSWVQPGDLAPARVDELRDALATVGLDPVALSAIRRSVIDPETGDENLAYSHRTIDAAAALGVRVVSVGLHRPLLPAQRGAFWFWTEEGPADATDPDTWSRAVTRLRELGRHAGEVGVQLSLEMYEDTLLGTAESAVRLVQDIGRDDVGLNPDLGNLIRLHRPIEDFQAAVAACLPVSNYWHVKSYFRDEDRTAGTYVALPAPMEMGSVSYRTAIRTAVDVGFTGPFCVEHYGGDGLSVSARNARYIRRMLAVATGEARESVLRATAGAR